jgi:hypothetical protein
MYRRDPTGLPVVSPLAKLPRAEAMNRLLQSIAWNAVTDYPLSGVTR